MKHRLGPTFYFDGEGGGGGSGSGGSGSGTPTPTPEPTPTPNMIPQDRFNEVTRQARDAQARADAAEQALREREDAEKSEKDRAEAQAQREKTRADQAEAELQRTKRNYALRAAAQEAGAISPDAIVALAESRKVEIDPDKPETISKAIESMKGDKDNPGPDAKLFGESNDPPAPTRQMGQPHAAAAPATANADETDDPKLAMGRGLLGAIEKVRGG